jgi:hypothetical protein
MSCNHPHHRPSFVWPILLIGTGIYLLLVNLGRIPPISWDMALRLWPVVLIIIGLDIIFGRRSLLGAIISSLFAFILVGLIFWILLTGPYKINGLEWLNSANLILQKKTIEVPLDDIKNATVNIDWGAGAQTLDVLPATSSNLLSANIEYYNNIYYQVRNEEDSTRVDLAARLMSEKWLVLIGKEINWQVSLHPKVIYDLNMEAIAGRHDFDLRNLHINHLKLNFTSGRCNLDLPEGNYDVKLNFTSGDINISLPKDAAARVYMDYTSGNFSPRSFKLIEGDKDGDGTWETPNYSKAEERIIFNIDQTSGNISIKSR